MDSIDKREKAAVLLATYNGADYLEIQIESLLAQTCQDFVIYVHDDGSFDKTPRMLLDYADRYPDKIQLLKGKPLGGAKENFLWMLSQVQADYYFFCDQDDVWFPEKIEKSLDKIKSMGEGPRAVFSDMVVVDQDLEAIDQSFISYIGRSPYNTAFSQILIDNPAAGCTLCMDHKLRDIVVEAAAKVDLKKIPMHDAFVLELASLQGKVDVIAEPLVYYRQTGHNQMGAETETTGQKALRNVENAREGGIKARKKAFINEAKTFAKEILKVDNIPQDKRGILQEFVDLDSHGKLYRMHFYSKYNFTRAHHNLWMRLWV